jgi:hypothetical protein
MPASISIPSAFNGPPDSGQGGYSAGRLAAFIDGPATVSLRRPVPLAAPLAVAGDDDGGVRLLDADALVAQGRAEPGFELDVPDAVGIDAAREASTRYRGERGGPFSRCFVCGLDRDDGFHVHAGEVAGRSVLASAWTPPDWSADASGAVRPEFVWAVLDCPATFAPLLSGAQALGFLAQQTARIAGPVEAGAEHVVIGWPIEIDGRKQHAGSALFTAGGELLAAARALLVAPRA